MCADLQDRNIIDEEIDPEDFLHVDDEPTSAISTDEEIVDCIRNKAATSHDEDGGDEVSILQPSITKEEALVCIDKLQMYFEQSESSNGSRETAFNFISKLCHRIHLTSTKMSQTTLTDYFTPLCPK